MALFGRGESSRERTAADREAARVERERRRALREGRTPPPAPQTPANEEPPAPDERPHDEPATHAEPQATQAGDAAPHEARPSDGEQPLDEQPASGEEPQAINHWAAAPRGEQPPAYEEPQAAQSAATEPHDIDPHATQEWSASESWGWDDDQSHATAHVAVPAGRHDAGEGGDEDEEILDQATVAFTPEEEHAATAPPAPTRTVPDQPVGGRPGRRTVQLPRAHAELTADEGHHHEEPIGTRRGGRPYAPQPGAPSPGHRRLTVPRRVRRRGLVAALVLLLVLVLGAAFFAYKLIQPGKGEGTGSVRVVIPTGATASQIGDQLAKAGVVDSGFFFDLRARVSGHRGDLRAGTYRLKRDMSYAAAIEALTTAPKAVPVLNATLPEGPSRRELAPIVRRAGVRGSYLKASARSSQLRPRAYGAPAGTRSLEGFLFPATYELRRSDATAKNLVARQLAAFKQNISKVSFRKARSHNLTVYDVLIIASMIEREARVPKERPLIAAVIYNRLRQGIPLGIDATIRYYERNWSRPLRVSELQRNEPYNTRIHQGLPPTPIGNPGLDSIRAAAAPAKVDYLYYVVKPCGNGAHSFSSTAAQFDRDVAAYNRKRDALGGKDPSTCQK